MERRISPLLGLFVHDLTVPSGFGTIWKLICAARQKRVFGVTCDITEAEYQPWTAFKKTTGITSSAALCSKAIQQIGDSSWSLLSVFCDLTKVGDRIGADVKWRSDSAADRGSAHSWRRMYRSQRRRNLDTLFIINDELPIKPLTGGLFRPMTHQFKQTQIERRDFSPTQHQRNPEESRVAEIKRGGGGF